MTDEEMIVTLNCFQGKKALAIIKPLLIAQGLREAAEIADGVMDGEGAAHDIRARVQELEQK